MTSDFSAAAGSDPAERDKGATPAPGSAVSLLPTQGAAPALSARLESWLASPGGLAVTAEVRLDRSGTELLAGSSVWATFRTGDGGQLVLSALARPSSGEAELLELTGVAMLAREHRRDAVRAGLRQDVWLVTGEVEHPATTLDLSSGGCRVQVADPSAFGVGAVVDVQLEVDGEAPLTTVGQVVRSDQVAHEVAVRFLDLTDDDEAVLDALVYSAIGSGA